MPLLCTGFAVLGGIERETMGRGRSEFAGCGGNRPQTFLRGSQVSELVSERLSEKAPMSEKVFASQERVSGFPETGLTSGEVRETSGKSGELPGNPWIAVKFHSERTSGKSPKNFRGNLGNFRGSPGTFQKLGEA